jgi:glutamate carboxypeptidase
MSRLFRTRRTFRPGKASHAGSSPEKGLNAIYELAHQMLQTKDFSDPSRGLKMNWRMVSGGTIKNQLIPGTKLDMVFEQRRPPLEVQPSQLAAGKLAQRVYSELGKTLKVVDTVGGGGTDAAFAALQTKNAVLERFGLQSFGAHSNDDEYILIDSIEPRLYLATRLIMDFSRGLATP